MADSYTPNLSLIKPEIGASRDSWGAKLNENADTIDEFLSMAMPVGAVLDYAGPLPPPGWLACDGRAISRTTYSELFAAIGAAWGAGDGSTTFNLPPANGRAAIGAGSVTDANGTVRAYSFAQRVGSLSYSILQANLPNVVFYTDAAGSHSHGALTGAGGTHNHTTDGQGSHSHGGTGPAGTHAHAATTDGAGSHAHNITSLPAQGAGAAGGGASVMSSVFGFGAYPTELNGLHQHTVTVAPDGLHQHGIASDGLHAHGTTTQPDHYHPIVVDGNHTHSSWSGGSGTKLEVVQPVMVVSKIIYAGSQAAPAAMTAAVPLVRRLMAAPMRGSH